MAITTDQILSALSKVDDPDFKKDLVTLKMIENIVINDQDVSFTIVLTTPACPLKEKLKNDCVQAIHETISSNINVTVLFTSNVTSVRNPSVSVLPNVKNIICVASGKGGVGKSTVAVNLAMGLSNAGAKVGLIDADIHGPSIPLMMGLTNEKPNVREIKGKHYMLPLEKDGIKVLSIGFLVDERQAIVWRGPMVTSALRQFVMDTIWGKLDYLIIDMPPGTGDVHLTMVQTVPVTGAIIVTTPQSVALADAKKAIAMFTLPNINVPIIGLIENMSYFSPIELPDNKYYIFGKGGGQALADEYEIPFLGGIPLVQGIREGGDSGVPALQNEHVSDSTKEILRNITENAAQNIALRNANHAPTKVVEIATT